MALGLWDAAFLIPKSINLKYLNQWGDRVLVVFEKATWCSALVFIISRLRSDGNLSKSSIKNVGRIEQQNISLKKVRTGRPHFTLSRTSVYREVDRRIGIEMAKILMFSKFKNADCV